MIIDVQNQRVKLLHYDPAEIAQRNEELELSAKKNGATKLIVYARKTDVAAWEQLGYQQEGVIEGFFNGRNAYLLCRYLTEQRAASPEPEIAAEVLKLSLARQASDQVVVKPLPEEYTLTEATEADAEELARLYSVVFPVYPTPMNDPAYIRKTMQASTYYMAVRAGGRIVCAASAEVDKELGSAEMTDCATHPDHLGKGLLQPVIAALETKMEEMGIYYLYTLTRSQSQGMNITAAKQGYRYRGCLINNCTIVSGFEDMNIWVKPLRETHD